MNWADCLNELEVYCERTEDLEFQLSELRSQWKELRHLAQAIERGNEEPSKLLEAVLELTR